MTDALDISFLRPNNEWDMKAGPAVLSAVYYSQAYSQVSYEIYLKVCNSYNEYETIAFAKIGSF